MFHLTLVFVYNDKRFFLNFLQIIAFPAIMPDYSYAGRTNLSSNHVSISSHELGRGAFRICYSGTFIGGNRNNQEAACKRFKSQYWRLEDEFFQNDFEVIDKAIEYASDWNQICPHGHEILITRGSVKKVNGEKYLVEPLIRYFTKFTSNNGWIASEDEEGWHVLLMEAFSHYTYHRSGGYLIVCDLQGRYRYDRYNSQRCRFELTDPAICSRSRKYGPTDMGEKGIDTFFHNHVCNQFCEHTWQRPAYAQEWFASTSATSMMNSTVSHKLRLNNTSAWMSYDAILEEEDSDDDY